MHPPLFVTRFGRITPFRRQAEVIALMEHLRVSLPRALPVLGELRQAPSTDGRR